MLHSLILRQENPDFKQNVNKIIHLLPTQSEGASFIHPSSRKPRVYTNCNASFISSLVNSDGRREREFERERDVQLTKSAADSVVNHAAWPKMIRIANGVAALWTNDRKRGQAINVWLRFE